MKRETVHLETALLALHRNAGGIAHQLWRSWSTGLEAIRALIKYARSN
jgi:hypothetical protein